MKVRLSKDPKRLDARLSDLSRELAQAEARAARAQSLRAQLSGQREAILKTMRGRVSDLALQYLQADTRRLTGFREWASEPKQAAMLRLFFDAASLPADVGAKAVKATGKRRGRPPGKKAQAAKTTRKSVDAAASARDAATA